jgi:hypothetical protein
MVLMHEHFLVVFFAQFSYILQCIYLVYTLLDGPFLIEFGHVLD